MNKLDPQLQTQVIASPIEGNFIRATCRMTGVAKGTVLSLLARAVALHLWPTTSPECIRP